MSGSINKVILIGRLGKDPEVKNTPGGAIVTKFSVATDESFKDRSGERQQKTEWHNIVTWNKLAEICGQYLTKGKLVYIEGKIQSRVWEDQGGNKRTSFEIVANEMKMLGAKEDSPAARPETGRPAPATRPQAAPEPEITDEDIPF